jgi:hypothetical protein
MVTEIMKEPLLPFSGPKLSTKRDLVKMLRNKIDTSNKFLV